MADFLGLQKRMWRIKQSVLDEVAKSMEASAEALVKDMKRRAPVLQNPQANLHRREGALRDSIAWTWGDAPRGKLVVRTVERGKRAGQQTAEMKITIFAGNEEAFYARWVEFGTVRTRAQPYFYGTYRGHRPNIKRRMTAAIRRGLKNG